VLDIGVGVEVSQNQWGDLLQGNLLDPRAYKRVQKKVLSRMGSEYVRRLKIAINQNQAGGPPLSEAWAKRKGHMRKWQDWFDLKNTIQKNMIAGDNMIVGIPSGAKNREGKQLDLIAMILEEGSFNIPARPLFKPVGAKLMKDKKFLEAVFRGALQDEIG
jgi:hypothetical protein